MSVSIDWRESKGGRISDREALAGAHRVAADARKVLEGCPANPRGPLALFVSGDTLIVGVKGVAADAIDLYECRIVRQGEAVNRIGPMDVASQRAKALAELRRVDIAADVEGLEGDGMVARPVQAPPASVPGAPGYKAPSPKPVDASPATRGAGDAHEDGAPPCARQILDGEGAPGVCGHGRGWHRSNGCEACDGVGLWCPSYLHPRDAEESQRAVETILDTAQAVGTQALRPGPRARLAGVRKLLNENVQAGTLRAVLVELADAVDGLLAAQEKRP